MADREVIHVEREEGGGIKALAGPWGRRTAAAVLIDIQNDQHTYYLLVDGERLDVKIVQGEERKHLRTNPDLSESDALDQQPEC